MKIKKKLNNNVAVVTDKTGNEIIVMGKGITYDKKAGDCVDVEQVEKQFVPSNKDFSMKFQEILLDIPSKYLEVILSILVYTLFSRMFDLMQPPAVKHSIAVV